MNALRRIGCHKTAEITEKAFKIVQEMPKALDDGASGAWGQGDERSELLAECDSCYFEGREGIEDSLFAFIKANRGRIEP